MDNVIRNNKALSRYELEVDKTTAFVTYHLTPGTVTLLHTEVPQQLSGRGIGSILARGVLETIRTEGLKVAPQCTFIAGYIGKHREFQDLVSP